jgi:NAD(P)-dependent dehydrogenase (short-subunit alcohol dehydrogenase family)
MALLAARTAIVTGAGRGNGAAIAIGLARAGAAVVVTDIEPSLAAETARQIAEFGGKAFAIRVDVTNTSTCVTAVQEARAKFGPISILVNNAGILVRNGFVAPKTLETFTKTLDVNVQGAVRMTEACLADLKETRGSIVNIASIQSYASLRNTVAYTTSKAALAQLTKALAVEFAADGIRVNALAPGIIETPMSAATRSDPATLVKFLERVPMKRCGVPEDLVGPVVFLCSEMANYVTGVVLPVDGGFLAI